MTYFVFCLIMVVWISGEYASHSSTSSVPKHIHKIHTHKFHQLVHNIELMHWHTLSMCIYQSQRKFSLQYAVHVVIMNYISKHKGGELERDHDTRHNVLVDGREKIWRKLTVRRNSGVQRNGFSKKRALDNDGGRRNADKKNERDLKHVDNSWFNVVQFAF